MIRFLVLIGVLFAIITGFAYLKETPGDLSLTIDKTNYSMDLAGAAAAVLILVIAALIVIWLLRLVLSAPTSAVKGWRGRRELKARRAMARGFLAIAEGDVDHADKAAREATKSLPGAPLTLLLNAQTAQLKGDREGARTFFNEMVERPETKVVGLRGLHIEAEREGQDEAARHYAEKALEAGSSVPWAGRALLRYQTAEGEWDMALATLALSDGKSRDKKVIRRKRAVILTAKALDLEMGDPDNAKKAALEAHQLEPGLVPAAMVAGRLLSRQGEIRRASKVLETTWKQNPHPDIAYAFAHARAGDSARDRLKRSETLQKLRPQVDEGRFAVARAAMEAREWSLARETLLPILKTRPTQHALMLMAEIEEGENGDSGRAREWLSRAVLAPRDKAWVSDGMILDDWAPASPVTGELDTVEWKVPAERLEPGETFKIEDLDVEARQPELLKDGPPPIIHSQLTITPAPNETKADNAEPQPGTASEKDEEHSQSPSSSDASEPKPGEKASEDVARSAGLDKAKPVASATLDAQNDEDLSAGSEGPSSHSNKQPDTKEPVEPARDVREEINEPPEPKTNPTASPETDQKTNGKEPSVLSNNAADKEASDAKAFPDDAAATEELTKNDGVDDETKAEITEPPLPDDPGVDKKEEDPEPKRFKLF